MSLVGRICCQFQGILRASKAVPSAQLEQCLKWNPTVRFYTRKANLARKAKKAQDRAQKKEFQIVRISRAVRPFTIDPCADKEPSTDDVWFQHKHPYKRVTFEEAINFHRETLHETVLNKPDAFINVIVVLNISTKKEGVYLDKVKGVFMPAHIFPAGRDIRILALCKEPEDVDKALGAGAFSAGGLKLIQSIEEGNLQVEEYDSVVAHTDVLTYLTPIRGLLKTKFPKVNQGTMGRDIAAIITKVKESRSYNLCRDTDNHSVGWLDQIIGLANMPVEHLTDNLRVYLRGILRQQPRSWDAPFITELYVKSPASGETFMLDRLSVLKEEVRTVGTKTEISQELIAEDDEQDERNVAQN